MKKLKKASLSYRQRRFRRGSTLFRPVLTGLNFNLLTEGSAQVYMKSYFEMGLRGALLK
jgi:hypothetical protein